MIPNQITISDGWLPVIITDADETDGVLMIKFFSGVFTIERRIEIHSPDTQTRQNALGELSAICHVCFELDIFDTYQLLRKPLLLKLADNGSKVVGYLSRDRLTPLECRQQISGRLAHGTDAVN